MYVLKAELPGVPKEDLLVEVSDERMLQLSVVQDLVKVEREDYHTKERAYRGFYHEVGRRQSLTERDDVCVRFL